MARKGGADEMRAEAADETGQSPAEAKIFAARLRPHRSLDRRGVSFLLGAVAIMSAAVSLPFWLMGAWPVVGFFGVDVLIVAIALRANMRAARAYEDISLSAIELEVAKVSARGARCEWRFNPVWVRLEKEEHEEFGMQRIALVSRGRELEIGAFLGPDAKASFARDFGLALSEARRGPRFS